MMIFPVSAMLVGPVSGYLCDRWGERRVCVAATALLLVACSLFMSFKTTSGMGLIVLALVVFGISISAFFTANISQVMSQAPSRKEGKGLDV